MLYFFVQWYPSLHEVVRQSKITVLLLILKLLLVFKKRNPVERERRKLTSGLPISMNVSKMFSVVGLDSLSTILSVTGLDSLSTILFVTGLD